MQKKSIIVLVLLLNMLSLQLSGQIKYTVNESWRFYNAENVQDVEGIYEYLDKGEMVDLPHTWNDKDVIDENEGYHRGAGWYSKEIRIPSTYKQKQVFLFFEGVGMVADMYINKQHARRHVGGFTRFVVPVSPYITFEEDKEFTTFNVLVKADNCYNPDVPPLRADFTFFGGIYRDVNLLVTDKVHFDIEEDAANGVFVTTPNVTAQSADVHLKVKLKNEAVSNKKVQLVTKLYGPDNELVNTKQQRIKLKGNSAEALDVKLAPVQNPQLWSPDTPHLYRLVCQIYDEKGTTKLDESVNSIGFRWYSFDAEEGFFLNGKHLKLIGTNRHQDFQDLGNAVPDKVHVEDILLMKAMGSNFLRIAHYPQDAAILELCDRLGIITTIETPIIDAVTESEAFTANCLSAQLEMVRQNYNHPSLIIWAYMNEVLLHPPYIKDKARHDQYCAYLNQLAQKLEDLTRGEDPYRYTMIVNHNNVDKYKYAGLTEIPKIVGFNIYLGWYGGGYELVEERFEVFRKGVKQPIIITEYGAGIDPRLHTLEPQRFDFTHEYGTRQHHHYLKTIMRLPYIAGANVWNYADFNSEGRVDAVQSINNKGLVSLNRKPKDAYFYYQASLLEEPFVAIATKTWGQRSYIEDEKESGISTMSVQVFSNEKEIELFHNGVSLGIQTLDSVIAVFDVPFVNGINKLRAVNASNQYCEDVSEVRINVLPLSLKNFPSQGMAINAGDKRFFYDDKIDQAWMIDKEYTTGSWGHIGGKPYVRPGKRKQQPYGAKQVIKGTNNDPVYQTQLTGIEKYRFDVPAGVYEITLHFAELEGTKVKHLPYDLAEDIDESEVKTNRTFSVLVNEQMVLKKLDILGQYGEYRAVKFKTEVSVQDGEPIIIDFQKVVGEPVLNAIELYKKH